MPSGNGHYASARATSPVAVVTKHSRNSQTWLPWHSARRSPRRRALVASRFDARKVRPASWTTPIYKYAGGGSGRADPATPTTYRPDRTRHHLLWGRNTTNVARSWPFGRARPREARDFRTAARRHPRIAPRSTSHLVLFICARSVPRARAIVSRGPLRLVRWIPVC